MGFLITWEDFKESRRGILMQQGLGAEDWDDWERGGGGGGTRAWLCISCLSFMTTSFKPQIPNFDFTTLSSA
jgi:hypothetical protein